MAVKPSQNGETGPAVAAIDVPDVRAVDLDLLRAGYDHPADALSMAKSKSPLVAG